MNPHAQSKDPYPLIRTQRRQAVLPGLPGAPFLASFARSGDFPRRPPHCRPEVVSENSVVNETGKQAVAAMRFKPFLVDGVQVQVMSQFTLPFKTTRLAPQQQTGRQAPPR